jgi:multiple antibiotic resistance protein
MFFHTGRGQEVKDLAAAFTIFFITLGPVKIVPPFFLMTHDKDRRTIWLLAFMGTIVSTAIALFVAIVVSSIMQKWRVSVDAVAIAGGILLLITSIKAITGFALIETPMIGSRNDVAAAGDDAPSPSQTFRKAWLGKPVLSPIAIPTIITPVGVAAILFFADAAVDDNVYKTQLIGVLFVIMALNFVAMILAGPIMRVVGVPLLQTIGWMLSALQAGLAVQIVIEALRRLRIVP